MNLFSWKKKQRGLFAHFLFTSRIEKNYLKNLKKLLMSFIHVLTRHILSRGKNNYLCKKNARGNKGYCAEKAAKINITFAIKHNLTGFSFIVNSIGLLISLHFCTACIVRPLLF